MANVGEVAVDVTADATGFSRDVEQAVRRNDNKSITVDINVDRNRFRRQLDDAIDGYRRSMASRAVNMGAEWISNFNQGLSQLGGDFGDATRQSAALGTALWSLIGIAASAAASLSALTVSIAPIAAGGAVASIGALALALNGVGDAFGAALSGDAEEFREAVDGLAPPAAAAAEAFRALAPLFEALQQSVQGAFFEGFADVITNLADALMGPLTEGLTQVASAFNEFLTLLAEGAGSATSLEFMSTMFDAISESIIGLAGPVSTLLGGMADLGTVAADSFGQVIGLIGDVLTSFGEWMSAMSQSADFQSSLGTAVDMLGTILGLISSITQGFMDFGLAAAPGVNEFLSSLTDGVGTALEPLGEAFGNILEAVSPLTEVLGDFFGMLGVALAGLAEAVLPLQEALFGLYADVLEPMIPVLGELIAALTEGLAPVFELLASILETLAPVLAEVVSERMEAFIPLVELLSEALQELAPAIEELIVALLEALIPVIDELMPLMNQFIEDVLVGLVEAIIELLPVIISLVEFLTALVQIVAPLIAGFAELAGWIGGMLVEALSWVIELVGTLIALFAALVSGIVTGITAAANAIGMGVNQMIAWFNTLKGWIDSVIGWFQDMWNQISGIIGDIGSAIGEANSAIGIPGFANGGIVNSPTLAMVGEAGPEAVIPLSRPHRAQQIMAQAGLAGDSGGGDRPINVTVNSNSIDPMILRRQVERAISTSLKER